MENIKDVHKEISKILHKHIGNYNFIHINILLRKYPNAINFIIDKIHKNVEYKEILKIFLSSFVNFLDNIIKNNYDILKLNDNYFIVVNDKDVYLMSKNDHNTDPEDYSFLLKNKDWKIFFVKSMRIADNIKKQFEKIYL